LRAARSACPEFGELSATGLGSALNLNRIAKSEVLVSMCQIGFWGWSPIRRIPTRLTEEAWMLSQIHAHTAGDPACHSVRSYLDEVMFPQEMDGYE
jgi:hypothetical protein